MSDRFDSPERLMQYAAEGRLTKHALATLLAARPRGQFLEACAVIEKTYTEACAAAGDPCLESGCSAEGEICLQPLMRAGTEYHKMCGAAWAGLFADPGNRVASWKFDATRLEAE
jgi:hypothetical protein